MVLARCGGHGTWQPGTATWYETQCVSWIAHYDALRRAAGVVFTPEQTRRFELWATAGPVMRPVVAP